MATSIQDIELLRKERERREKEIREVAEKTKENMGYNSGSTNIDLKETPNGPALVIRGDFDPFKLPGDWKYESNYRLDSDYGKEGIWHWEGGKREFIEIKHEADKSEVVQYRSPDDIVDAFLAENYHIHKDQIYFDEHSGAIIFANIPNNIVIPQGLETQGGFIVSTNDADIKTEIKKESANNISKDAITAGSGEGNTLGVQENLAQQSISEDPTLSKFKDQEDVNLQDLDINMLDFSEMAAAFEQYTNESKGGIVEQEKEGSEKVLDNQTNEDINVKTKLALANIWKEAFESASGMSNTRNMSFTGETSHIQFDTCIKVAKGMHGATLEEYASVLFQMHGFESSGFVKTMLYFISNPKISSMLQINCSGMTPEGAIAKVDELKSRQLKEEFAGLKDNLEYGLIDQLREHREGPENDMERVMERRFNNNNIY